VGAAAAISWARMDLDLKFTRVLMHMRSGVTRRWRSRCVVCNRQRWAKDLRAALGCGMRNG
jgi:hypothetical protein